MKCVVITLFNQGGLEYMQAAPDGQTVNADCYVEVLKRLITVHVLCKWSHYCNGQWKLHHDNAHPHVAQCIWDVLTLHGVEVIVHVPTVQTSCLVIFFIVSYT